MITSVTVNNCRICGDTLYLNFEIEGSDTSLFIPIVLRYVEPDCTESDFEESDEREYFTSPKAQTDSIKNALFSYSEYAEHTIFDHERDEPLIIYNNENGTELTFQRGYPREVTFSAKIRDPDHMVIDTITEAVKRTINKLEDDNPHKEWFLSLIS